MNDWTEEWPTAEGMYWFYGWLWCDKYYTNLIERKPQCSIVDVKRIANGALYVSHGTFLHKNTGRHVGLWHKVDLDNLPDLTPLVNKFLPDLTSLINKFE